MSSTPSSEPNKFKAFCKHLDLHLEAFQMKIVRDLFGKRRETLILIPRGNGKTTLLAALALWHLLTRDDAKIAVGAASREQAGVLFDIARNLAANPKIAPKVEITRREIRTPNGWLKVVASDGPKQHGLDLTLAIVDELHAHHDDELYIALRTGLLKRPDAQLWTITTAGVGDYSALGQLRARARQLPKVTKTGFLTRAIGPSLGMLEWSLPDDVSIDDMKAVKKVNPASWLDIESLREQREAVHEIAFRRYHANQWVAAEAPWISGEAWDACSAEPVLLPERETILGVDASIRRDATAVAIVQRDPDGVYHARFEVWEPTQRREVPLETVTEFIREQTRIFNVQAVTYDPQFMHHASQRLQDEGIEMIEWRQDNSRMVPATATLHEAVMHKRLRHGGDEVARRHALNAGVYETERGLRIKKTASRGTDDAVVALAMAVEWASRQQAEQRRSRYSDPDAALVVA
jgi:phage terminase large subunit-like protein